MFEKSRSEWGPKMEQSIGEFLGPPWRRVLGGGGSWDHIYSRYKNLRSGNERTSVFVPLSSN